MMMMIHHSSSEEEEEEEEEDQELALKDEDEVKQQSTTNTNSTTKKWLQDAFQHPNSTLNPYHRVLQQQQQSSDTENWMEYRKCGLDGIVDDTLLDEYRWEATVGLGNHRERREFIFSSSNEAEEFVNQLEGLKLLVQQRAQSRLEAYHRLQEQSKRQLIESFQKSTSVVKKKKKNNDPTSTQQQQQQLVLEESLTAISQNSEINLLLEIVSASDVPIIDRNSTDPYVSVYMGATKIHRTKSISKE